MLKGILKTHTLPEWKEADEIIRHVWLGTITENEHARRRNITEVICVSKEPQADLQREGFKKAPDLDTTTFTIDSDTEGDMLSIFGEVCDAIDRTLAEGEGVLVWDVGGGVAAMAAYIMRRAESCLAEAMTVITRARFLREKRPLLPSQRMVDLLHNDIYQAQLDMWQACKYDIYENVIVNPSEPREKWVVEKVDESSEKRRNDVHDVQPTSWRPDEKFLHIPNKPHHLSTVEEVEEEVRRLSMIYEK